MNIEEQPQDQLQPKPPAIKDKPIKLPDPDYTPPAFMNTRRIKDKMAVHSPLLLIGGVK